MRRFMHFGFLGLAGLVLWTAGLSTPARAQDPDDLQRGVARISLMNGEVSVRRGDSGEWVAGVINAPLLSDDRISTGPNSRAEVQFDAANILRIGGNAEVRLTQLEATRYQMEMAHGTVTFRVLRPSNANVEVDTPSVSVRPSKQGIYRITVNDAGESEVTARAGEVEVFTPRGSQWVNAGQTMMARGTGADPEFQIVNAIPGDDWDRWNDSRDRVLTESTSYQYVGPGVYGVEDLDANGTWTDVAPYGPVWQPTVGVGVDWAPYRNGRWVWEDWYGWTWVSYDPWGWAPYHYGRWFRRPGFGWCWYPGGLGIRHYWSPGLVAFFGYGGGVGVGFGFGHVGWVPLAPYEVFHPWWGRGFYGRPGFERNLNITNVNITNVYRNARFNGVSGVSATDFRSGRFNSVSRVSGEQVREAGLVRGQVPIGPSSANTHFSDRAATHIPQGNTNNRFFTHQQPNPAPRMPFSQQQGSAGQVSRGGVEAQGRGFNNPSAGARESTASQGTGGTFRGQQPQPAAVSRGSMVPSGSGSGGWRRFGEPAGQSTSPRGSTAAAGFRGATPNQAF
ncbi:MAG TPA: FecR family protein, partial [Bryobacteraceae bacterium]|nr:FecR family protein [Bryobacteraceae bacterium]